MSSQRAYRQVLDRFDGVTHGGAVSTVGLLRREVPGLGHALFMDVLADGERHALYPMPECTPERGAQLISSTPLPDTGAEAPMAALMEAGNRHGVTVLATANEIIVRSETWDEVLRQPHPDDRSAAENVALAVLGYLEAIDWIGGLVVRLCPSCGGYRPLRDFAATDDHIVVLPECRRHWASVRETVR